MYKDTEKQNAFQRAYQRKQRLARKHKAIKMLGGKCKKCGYDENINALQIDHIKPILRKQHGTHAGGNLSRRIANGALPMTLFQVLCANCHAIKTYEERKSFASYKH